ncbi:MAG TPA: toll/interleukin-1 receptor domain-containing protein, partial [Anaeromyxobacteraceae bacterium]
MTTPGTDAGVATPPAPHAAAAKMPAVFISYSRTDKEFVQRLHESLRACGYEVWVDWEDIPPSAEWFEEIRAGVTGADGFIYVISPESVVSEVCSRELQTAVDQRKRIVP